MAGKTKGRKRERRDGKRVKGRGEECRENEGKEEGKKAARTWESIGEKVRENEGKEEGKKAARTRGRRQRKRGVGRGEEGSENEGKKAGRTRTVMSTTASSQQKLYPMFMPNEHQKKHIFRLNTSVSIITPAIPPVTIHHLTLRPHWHFKL
ncbi:hypothetical protein Pcinc_026889 [Petrolisthes cinctipes]|uniref:Uncharacterized protein n=1 Tax=Petrolisthes cinctipes TaxID=88211 RepID=A0AAE1F611_PETCI|nr:hypothetical protein Pcinc_026889 [Petrolisthes cinctipes]